MTLDRHLARLLAAVIVMITATFGVSAAQAHEGHEHHPQAPAVAAAPVTESVDLSTSADASVIQQAKQPATALVAAQASTDDVGQSGGCDGRCCTTSMACCHAAVTPATLAMPSLKTLSSLVLAPQQTVPSSLTPEALPKPPRSFA